MARISKKRLRALIARLPSLPSYDQHEMGANLYTMSGKNKVYTPNVRVMLLNEEWRSTLISALQLFLERN